MPDSESTIKADKKAAGSKALVAEIIIVGNELASADMAGRSFLRESLFNLGIKVERVSIVSGEEHALEGAINKAIESKDINLLIVAGGLGAGHDEITSKVAARVTGKRLVVSNEILAHIKRTIHTAGREMTPSDERSALIPQKAEPLKNPTGPTCGYLLRQGGNILVFMPGGNEDVRAMTKETLLPLLYDEIPDEHTATGRVFHTFGISEAAIKDLLPTALGRIEGIELDIVPLVDELAVRLTARGKGATGKLEDASLIVRENMGEQIFAEDDGTMEETVGSLLKLRRDSLSLAESCTGGGIGRKITNVPGSSDYFEMGLIAYSNEAKTKLLGVQPSVIEEHGAVSSRVAIEMAVGAKRMGRTSIGLSVTGIAGPGGGSEEKPVGTVFIGISLANCDTFEEYHFNGSREEIRRLSMQAALDLLRRKLISS
ncbi:MAG: CinA family nicotinamide mononucleotide deamidase-related protein [bacterium]|nr:CinA family nicotinamide mononucleotide deamidase-related protein [bacterium]